MSQITVGKKVPDFSLPATGGGDFKLSDFKGRRVVLYFYPRDNTPGCTLEGRNFRDAAASFKRSKTVVFGVSRDTLAAHEKFKAKQKFSFELLADPGEEVCELFGVMKKKNLYGKKVRGIERSTFLIDEKGVLLREWRKVRVLGHVKEVLGAVQSL